MIKIKEIYEVANKEGHKIDASDVSFAIYVLHGYGLDDCIIYSGKHIVKADARGIRLKTANVYYLQNKAKKIMAQDNIRWLIIFLKPIITKNISDAVFSRLDDFDFIPRGSKESMVNNNIVDRLVRGDNDAIEELSESDIKKALACIVRKLTSDIDNIDAKEIKDLVPSLKFYVDRFAPKQEEDAVARHIIMAEMKHNAICPHCNKEITVSNGLINICSHCKGEIDLIIKKKE